MQPVQALGLRVPEAWGNPRHAGLYRRCVISFRLQSLLLLGASIASFAVMVTDGNLVNTHLRSSRCVHPQFQEKFPLDCNGLVVCFPTLVLIVTVLCFATLACLLWIGVFLVESNLSRALQDLTTGKLQDIASMLMVFSIIKVIFVSAHAVFIGMTWYSNLADTRVVGLVMVGLDVVEIFVTLSAYLKIHVARRLLEDEEMKQAQMRKMREHHRLQQLPEIGFGELNSSQENCIICLVDFDANSQVTQLACGHIFHASCIKTWLAGKTCSCPYRCHTAPLAEA